MRKIVFLRKKCNIYCELNLTVLDPGKATIGTRLNFLYYTRENILISFSPGPRPKGLVPVFTFSMVLILKGE